MMRSNQATTEPPFAFGSGDRWSLTLCQREREIIDAMYLVVIFILTPFLLPFLAGGLLGFGVRRTRSDILALFVGLSILLFQSVIMKRIGFNHEEGLSLFPQTNPTNTILLLSVLSSILMRLIFPYIFARWGVELADRIRYKKDPATRQSSKGNLILGIMFAVLFAASFAQTIPIMTTAFCEAREETANNKDITKSSNSTSNTASSAVSEAAQG